MEPTDTVAADAAADMESMLEELEAEQFWDAMIS